ncbi:MAG: SLC13/DASS family transporter [Planctomycetaceae bacterium]|nr:SLC13/DASS family transporter [Planctomycetaceae bacterium]
MQPEALSPLEQSFERWRKRAGAVLAPAAFLAVLIAPLEIDGAQHRLAAVMAAVVVLWVSEALPMPLTALLGPSACVVLQVAPAKEVFAPFADPLIFLFIGSFILARAIFLHGLDKRVAYAALSLEWVGARPSRILLVFGAATAAISAWISNTATTAMMFAIGLSLVRFLYQPRDGSAPLMHPRYATGLMLMTSFSASIGGLATPVGTPPNLIGISRIRDDLGVDLQFFDWCLIGVPVVLIMYAFLFGYLNFFCPAGVHELAGSRELITRERAALGPWTTAQKSTLAAFIATVCMWFAPGVIALAPTVLGAAGDPQLQDKLSAVSRSLPEGVAALIGAALLFLLPGGRTESGEKRAAITWDEAVEIDWGVVLLYGGGFAMGVLAEKVGLAATIGNQLTAWLPEMGPFGILLAGTVIAVITSETTSNTASAALLTPLVIAFARSAGVDPLPPALGATMGASLGFMLPVSTPCNAIVYGSGMVPLTRMIRYGLLLDIVGVAVIVTVVSIVAPYLK